MEIVINIIKVFFALFMCYTLVYIFQWIIGLCVSVFRLSGYRDRVRKTLRVIPDEIARQYPVSVIIPAYNEEACIRDTVDSLLKEGYPKLNIIVVDDGSSDRTSACVIEEYQMEQVTCLYEQSLPTQPIKQFWQKDYGDKRVTLICKQNGGKADALNCGLNLCQDPYCMVLDADTKVEPGAIRIMVSQFLMDEKVIVCAGVVGTALYDSEKYRQLSLAQRALVLFQELEYFRTFYIQRLMFDRINANVIVSGAFSMADSAVVKKAGGYRINTIGEDMELTMRLHAFCMSQNRDYRITYVPEAKCTTEVPFRYKDYYRQRRRWHIGMIQSMKQHPYMLGSSHYGWAGFMASSFILIYELIAPIIETLGVVILIATYFLDILSVRAAIIVMVSYGVLSVLTQGTLLHCIRVYGVEKISALHNLKLHVVSVLEIFFFHPLNVFVKLNAFATARKNKKTWNHIQRVKQKT